MKLAIYNHMDGPKGYYVRWRSQIKTNSIRFHLQVESKEQANNKKAQKWTHKHREETWLPEGQGVGDWVNKQKGLKETNFQIIK